MTQTRLEREQKILADYPKGTIVRVKEPDAYIPSVASKLCERLGEVVGHQMPTPNPIVGFHAIGRKKSFQKVFSFPHADLEIVTDAQEIAKWREAVAATQAKADLVLKKKLGCA